MRAALLIVAVGLSLSGCSAEALRQAQAEAREPTSMKEVRGRLAGKPLTVERLPAAPSIIPDDVPPEEGVRFESVLNPATLAFTGVAVSEAQWRKASAEGLTKGPLGETTGLVLMLARSEQLRGAWLSRVGAAQRHSQTLGLRRLLDQYEGFARDPRAPPVTTLLPTPESIEGAVVAADVEVEQVRFEGRTFELLLRFTEAFHEARYRSQLARVQAERVTLAGRLVEAANARFASSGNTSEDVLRAEMARQEAIRELKDAQVRQRAVARELGSVLGTDEPVSAGAPRALLPLPDLRAVRRVAAERSLEVRAAEARLVRSQQMLNLSERTTLPEFQWGLTAPESGMEGGTARSEYGYEAPWLAELRARVLGAQRLLGQARLTAAADAEAAHARLSGALRGATLYEAELFPKSTQLLATLEVRYKLGRASYVELDDALNAWLRIGLGRHEARRDAHIAAAELERILGSSLGTVPRGEPGSRQKEVTP